MKICPSCNARVSKSAAECISCGYRWGEGSAKQTMMGLPALMIDDESEGAGGGASGGDARKTLFGLPAVSWDDQGGDDDEYGEAKTEVVDPDEFVFMPGMIELGDEGSDDSTRQIDAENLAGMLGPQDPKATAFGLPSPFTNAGEDSEAEALSAWGLAEVSEQEEASTRVVSPEALGRGEEDGGVARMMGFPPPQEQKRDHRTLMGMSLEGLSDDFAAGAMISRPAAADEEVDDSPTRVVGPGVFKEFEPERQDGPGRLSMPTPVDEDLETMVVSEIPDFDDFELPSLSDEETVADVQGEAASLLREERGRKSGESVRPASPSNPFHREGTPKSGVFRLPKRRQGEDSPDSGALAGTGTYQVSHGESDSQRESPFALGLGAPGGGGIGSGLIGGGQGRTAFPTGGRPGAKVSQGVPESGRPGPAKSGPRFSVPERGPLSAPPAETKPVQPVQPDPVALERPANIIEPVRAEERPPQIGAPAAFGSEPTFGAEPAVPGAVGQVGIQGVGAGEPPFGAELPQVQSRPLVVQEVQPQSASVRSSEMVPLVQKMLAIVAALILMGTTMVVMVTMGRPETLAIFGVVVAPAILAIGAVLVAALPVSERGRAVGLGVVAGLVFMSGAGAYLTGIGLIAGAGQALGGLVLGGAAALPKLMDGRVK